MPAGLNRFMKQWQIFLMSGLFLLVCNSLGDAEAAASPVTISSDVSSADILVSEFMEATLTIENSDTTYRTMDVYLITNWASGVAWTTYFFDTNYDPIEDYKINMSKGGSEIVKFIVFCDGVCSAGDTNTVQVIAKTDPKFYNYDGNVTDTCGSDDCETDTSPASASSNVTNTITMTFTARTSYASYINCDVESSEGGNELSKGNTYLWGYALTNAGWNTDTYQFTSVVTSADGHSVDYWTTSPGIANGKELTGQSDSSSTAVHSAAGSISITPATDAAAGVYNVELTVVSTNGAPNSGCDFDVVIPAEEAITVSVAKVDTPPHPEWEWNYTWTAEVDNLEMDVNYTAVIVVKRVGDDEWEGLDWWWDIDQESNSNPFALQRGCYFIFTHLYESDDLNSNVENSTVLTSVTSAVLDFVVGNGICVDGAYYYPDEVEETEEAPEEKPSDAEEESREVPAISLVLALISIGIIAIFRRK